MAKIKVIRYQCDMCKLQFENEKDLETTNIPCYGGERNEYHSNVEVNLCAYCSENLRMVIVSHFPQINNLYRCHRKMVDVDSIENISED